MQLALPIEVDTLIPTDESVRLLDWLLEDLDYTKLYQSYSREGRNPVVSPKTLFKVLILAYSQGIYSSREIERACRINLTFRWLLRNEKTPDHNTIARFRKERLAHCAEALFTQLVEKLFSMGEIAFENLFIDGTKMEANANRYTFVWRKASNKYEARLQGNVRTLLSKRLCAPLPEGLISSDFMSTILETWKKQANQLGIQFVSGKGKHKTSLQRDYDKLQDFCTRQRTYEKYNSIFKGRNSFSKTDPDATFMRMKDDYMRNGQLKPAYNLQLAIESEYIVGVDISSERSDMATLKPLLGRIEKNYGRTFAHVICDAGYESVENYTYLDKKGYKAFIKPSNYEYSKTRAFQKAMEFRNSMVYLEDEDCFLCKAGRKLSYRFTKQRKTGSGFIRESKVYECESCAGCPYLGKCYKGKYSKRVEVCEAFDHYRNESLNNISSEHGTLLRVNRSIQAEGVFAQIKWNRGFQRYLTRGECGVRTESLLLAIAMNIDKLHYRIQGNRLGQNLFPLSA